MKNFTKIHYLFFYFIFIVATVLMFSWQRHLYPYINTDGVTYIQVAAAYLQGGFKTALAIGDQAQMPFFSILIAKLSALTHLSVLTSAYVLNNFFVCLSGVLFLIIIQNISQSIVQNSAQQKIILILSAIIWLDWHAYTSWWPLVMRDHGAMSLLLLSTYFLLKFYNKPSFKWAITWSLALLVGALFRFELGIFLVLVPLVLCSIGFESKKEKILNFFKLNSVLILCCLAGSALFFTGIISLQKLHGLRVSYIIDSAVNYFVIAHQFFIDKKIIFSQQLSPAWQAYASGLLIIKLIYRGLETVINIIGPIGWMAIVIWFFVRKQKPVLNNKAVIVAYFLVSIIIPLAFYYQNLFLNSRYVLPLGVFALIALAPSLAYIIQHRNSGIKRMLCYVLILVFIYNFIASIHRFGHVSNYQHNAGVWLKKNLPNKTIFTNAKITMFYASDAPSYSNGKVQLVAPENWVDYFSKETAWQQYDFLILTGSTGQVQKAYQYLFDLNEVGPVTKIFNAEHGGGVILITPIMPVTA